jgi:hypothetical protein
MCFMINYSHVSNSDSFAIQLPDKRVGAPARRLVAALVRPERIELPTFAFEARRSNHRATGALRIGCSHPTDAGLIR